MRIDYNSKTFTLDWDDITIGELRRRLAFMEKTLSSLRRYTVSLSPMSGYHIRVECHGPVCVATMRDVYKDDGRRLVNDILNRPDYIHDILWSRKTNHGVSWESKGLYSKQLTH